MSLDKVKHIVLVSMLIQSQYSSSINNEPRRSSPVKEELENPPSQPNLPSPYLSPDPLSGSSIST